MDKHSAVPGLHGPSAANAREIQIMRTCFLLDTRYELREVVGTGAYSVVASALDTATGGVVAVKKMDKSFLHSTFAKRTLRELKIQRLLTHHNILRIKTIQLPQLQNEWTDLYVITDLMESDLSSIIKSPQDLSDEHCQFFLFQLLQGLKYMKDSNILHRDLKPKNLLLNANCDLKVCDFGLARVSNSDSFISSVQMTDYVATR